LPIKVKIGNTRQNTAWSSKLNYISIKCNACLQTHKAVSVFITSIIWYVKYYGQWLPPYVLTIIWPLCYL